jgi:hypothetical protein
MGLSMDLNVFFCLKYTEIIATLVAKGDLSTLDHVGRLSDGLSLEPRKKAMKFCTKLEAQCSNTGTVEPKFDELRRFGLTEGKATQKEVVCAGERPLRRVHYQVLQQLLQRIFLIRRCHPRQPLRLLQWRSLYLLLLQMLSLN